MTLDYYKVQLKETAEKLSEFKKGILAVDESTKTIGKRLFDIDVENTEENQTSISWYVIHHTRLRKIYQWCDFI